MLVLAAARLTLVSRVLTRANRSVSWPNGQWRRHWRPGHQGCLPHRGIPCGTASLRSRDRPNVAVAGLARGTELPISGSSGRNPRRTRVGVSRAVGSVLSVREQEARRPVGPLSDIPDSRSLSLQPVANCRPSGLNATAHTTWVIPRPSWWTSRSCSWPRAAHGRRPRPAPSLARRTREARSGDQSPGRAGGAWFIRLWCPVPGRAPMEVDSRRSRRRRERDQRGSRRTGPRR